MKTCAHCGLEFESRQKEQIETLVKQNQLHFCCHGCASVYHLLHDLNLDEYYRFDHQQSTARPVKDLEQNPEVLNAQYAYLDLNQAQYTQADGLAKVQLKVQGMHCAACVWVLERGPEYIEGLKQARAHFGRQSLQLTWDPKKVPLSMIAQQLHKLGYRSELRNQAKNDDVSKEAHQQELIRLGVSFALMGNIMLLAFAEYGGTVTVDFQRWFRWLSMLLSLPLITYSARPFWRGAWQGIKAKTPHMDMPISLGIIIAFLSSSWSTVSGQGEVYFDSLASLIFLLLLGRFIQLKSQTWAMKHQQYGHELIPKYAWVMPGDHLHQESTHLLSEASDELLCQSLSTLNQDGLWKATALHEIQVGDYFKLQPNEICPLDGVIVYGDAQFDEAFLSGESRWLGKQVASKVYQGSRCVSINPFQDSNAQTQKTAVIIKAQARASDSKLSIMLDDFEQAQSQKTHIEAQADWVAMYLVIAVFLLSVGAGIYWGYFMQDWQSAFDVIISLCIVTCPCALGLATPLAVSIGLAKAKNLEIYIQNPETIMQSTQLGHLVFDKTGTLTTGKMKVTSQWIKPELEIQLDELSYVWKIISILESHSSHPIAQSLSHYAEAQAIEIDQQRQQKSNTQIIIHQIYEELGKGIKARCSRHMCSNLQEDEINIAKLDSEQINLAGHHSQSVAFDASAFIERLLDQAQSPLGVWFNGVLIMILGLSDELRTESRQLIKFLRSKNYILSLCSGDHKVVTESVATHLEFHHYQGRMSPQDKAEYIRQAQKNSAGNPKRPLVAMIGDGLNDTIAMATSDIGISVSGGLSIVDQGAHVFLPQGIRSILSYVEGVHAVQRLVRFNIRFALVYNMIFASLALMAYVTPLVAAIIMPISSISIVLSSALYPTFTEMKA